jgi:hypothetical protein
VKLSDDLLKKLAKKYEPSSMIDTKYKGKDLVLKTDRDGNAVVLFIGKVQKDGKIRGERFTRILVRDANGALIKDHWDHKGKT